MLYRESNYEKFSSAPPSFALKHFYVQCAIKKAMSVDCIAASYFLVKRILR